MWFDAPPLILAQDGIGGLITIVVLILTFLSWIMNLATGKQQAGGARPAAGPRPRDERLRNEIDAFLKEVGGPQKRRREQPADDMLIEIIDEEPQQRPVRRRPPQRSETSTGSRGTPASRRQSGTRRPSQQRGQSSRPARQPDPQPEPQPQPSTQPVSRLQPTVSQRAEELGTTIRDHLAEYMDSRIDKEVAGHLERAIEKGVSDHLKAASSPGGKKSPAGQIQQLIRSPHGARQAILLNEILSPPKSLRGGARKTV